MTRAPDRRRPPVLVAALSQAAAAALVFGAAGAFGLADTPVLVLLVLQGAVAAGIGAAFGLARWWIPLHLLLPPAAAWMLWSAVPPWIYLVIFAGLAVLYWNSAGQRVPLFLSNARTRAALAGQLPEREGLRIVDLGSGLAGPVVDLARRRPDCRVLGLETAPVPFLLSRLRLALAGPANARVEWRDFRRVDLGDFDAVYCFLSPEPMPALWDKARREMKPGSLLISNSFAVPGHPADRTVTADDRRHTVLHVWHM